VRIATRTRQGYGDLLNAHVPAAAPHSPRRAWSIENAGNAAARRELATALLDVAADALADERPVLDVGCGTGWWLETLAHRGAAESTLHGVDVDPARVTAAARRVPGAAVEVGDARALHHPDRSFGLVTLIVVLSALARPAAIGALCEARRVLAPGGTIAVYEPRLPNPLNRATRLVTDRDLDRGGLHPRQERSLTLLPPLGRRLGPVTATLHPALSRIGALRSHRLLVYRDGSTGAASDAR
jgi:SAM-dependent methyltransferase